MAIPERIAVSRLTEVYGRMRFYAQPTDPLTFEREDGLMMFHAAYGAGEVYWITVMEDIERTEKLHRTDEGLKEEFFNILSGLFEDDAQCK